MESVTPEQGNPKHTGKYNRYLDPNYKGEPLRPDVRDGPIEKRKCTDVICCLIFTLFLIAWFVCGFYGFSEGEPELLTYPYDSSRNQCGKPGDDAEDYDYIYFPYPLPGYLDYTVCVKDCPEEYDSVVDCYTND